MNNKEKQFDKSMVNTIANIIYRPTARNQNIVIVADLHT